VLVFSPHPDDDVISMGGILPKLTQNRNEITVAYMTSGNIAVFDHDVRRYMDFLERLARERGIGKTDAPGFVASVREFLATKAPGTVDSDAIEDRKRIIIAGRGRSGRSPRPPGWCR
jgi:glucosamine-6-phosphate deaminase